MSLSLTVFAFLLVLGPLILIHELGHFIAAKRGGIRVLEFGMGYPPRAVRLWRGKGALTINGASVIIPRNFRQLPKTVENGKWVRAVTTQIDGRSVLQSITVLDNHAAAGSLSDQADVVGTQLFGEVGDFDPGTEYTLNWLPLGGFVRMFGEEGLTGKGSFGDAPKRWRATTLLAGPGANLLAAILLFTATYMIGYPEIPIIVEAVAANSPAAQAGIQAHDAIVAIGGEPIRRIDQVQRYVGSHAGQRVTLAIRHGDQTYDISLTPRTPEQIPAGQGAMGVQLSNDGTYHVRQYPFGEAIGFAFSDIGDTVQQIVTLPARLLGNTIAAGDARVMGPVGISQVAGAAVQETVKTGDLFWILGLVSQISLALAITNLLPLPALDGGRLVFVLIEAVRRKRIAPEREAIVHLVGLALLLGLMVLITIQDISNPIIRN